MDIIKNKVLLSLALAAFFLGSFSACNLTNAAKNDNSANDQTETVVANSSAPELSAVNTSEKTNTVEVTPQTVAGRYRLNTYKEGKGGQDNTLEIEDKGNGKLHVSISASNVWYTGDDPQMHEGGGEGDAQLKGSTAIAKIISDGDGDGDNPCQVTITFKPNQAKVAIAKDCSFNVAVEGLYVKEKTKPANNVTKDSNQPASLKKVSYSQLEDFINDFQKNKTGTRFVITDVPAEKISKTEKADTAGGNKNFKGLYYFQTDDNDTNVATAFIGSSALYKDYVAKVEYEPAKLRVTAVIVEFPGEFDVYRSSFVTQIEGLENDGKVVWTIKGTEPASLKIPQ